ncbi:MAG: hypothetical protein WC488_03815 [Candidatus Micrarchaeia archaeon]
MFFNTKRNDAKDGSMKADVAVVGAGFAGLGPAYYIRESGLDVLIPALLNIQVRERVLKAYADIARTD